MLETIVIGLTIIGSLFETIRMASDYLETREEDIRKKVAIACDYTNKSFIQNKSLTDDEYKYAVKMTKDYFKSRCYYFITNKKLETYIHERFQYVFEKIKS